MNKNVRTVIQSGAEFESDTKHIMLAYFWTAVCLVIAGVFSIEALGTAESTFSGWLLVIAGVATFLFGAKHYSDSRRVRQPVVSSNCSRLYSR